MASSDSEPEKQEKSGNGDEEVEVIEPERDPFDISDSDDGGLVKKVATKVAAKKKVPPKKLTKMTDLFPSAMASKPADKKVPGPQTGKKHKKSESESEKPAKKKTKFFESDSDSDFQVSPRPKSKRGLFLIICFPLSKLTH